MTTKASPEGKALPVVAYLVRNEFGEPFLPFIDRIDAQRYCGVAEEPEPLVTLADHQAAIAALQAQLEALRSAAKIVIEELDEQPNGDGPGHCHEVPGVWDSDNGRLAGKPCAWCADWRKFKDAARGKEPT